MTSNLYMSSIISSIPNDSNLLPCYYTICDIAFGEIHFGSDLISMGDTYVRKSVTGLTDGRGVYYLLSVRLVHAALSKRPYRYRGIASVPFVVSGQRVGMSRLTCAWILGRQAGCPQMRTTAGYAHLAIGGGGRFPRGGTKRISEGRWKRS